VLAGVQELRHLPIHESNDNKNSNNNDNNNNRHWLQPDYQQCTRHLFMRKVKATL
jgi:hypothetical protein